jgi:putative nucleotidyltransferase with HDIG domain
MLEEDVKLREKAYNIIKRKGDDFSQKFENSDLKTLLHELDVYQAELEAQNEDLREKEIKLSDSRIEYENLFMDSPVAFLLIDNKLNIQKINQMANNYFGFRFLNDRNKMFISLIANKGIKSFFSWIDKKDYEEKHLELDLICNDGINSFRLDAKPYVLKKGWLLLTLKNIENEKLWSLQKLENYKEILYALVDMIEKRDPYTAGHSKRVALYSKKIAEKMHFTKVRCNLIYEAAILHDIGKIVIPDAVLLKPSSLNNIEYELIKKHSSIGYDLLSKINNFKEIANIIHYHHERVDGFGYPSGLKGEEIPIESKVLAVADAFDAMTTNRIYGKKKSIEDSLKELTFYKNSMYDSQIVDIAIDVLSKLKLDENISQNPITQMENARFSYFYNDQLTQVYNIDYLDFILNRKIIEDYNYLNVLSLKNFSMFNKKNGWLSGDDYLKNVAIILKNIFLDSDNLIFRIFGDDFLILSKIKHNIDLDDFSLLDDSIIKIKFTSYLLLERSISTLKDINKLGI